jgi:endonuclease/exonuclease/phosphatase (EEP) superfamily protein YafD
MPTEKAPADNPSVPSADEEPVRNRPQEITATGRWFTGTRLLVAATAAWVVFLVLHILFTGRWWPWFIFEAIPPLTAVAVPLLLLVFVPLARPVRRRLSVVLVLLLLVGAYLAGYGPRWTGTATGTPRGTPVKVFVWNTSYWQMSNDKDAFYAFLRRQDADVYLLQEHLYAVENNGPYNTVIRIDDSARLRAEFPGYQLSIDGPFVTLSRLPIVAAHHQRTPSAGTDWFWKGTKAPRTDIRVGGRTVSFYNVQLPVPFRLGDNPFRGGSSGGGLSRLLKEQSTHLLREQGTWRLEELRKLRTDLAGNPHPAVLAGDFNSPWMDLYSLGAGARAHSPSSLAPPRTWPVSDYPLPRLWHLDWLYTTGDLAVPSYHLVGGKAFSDHLAQKFSVVVPDEAPSAHIR